MWNPHHPYELGDQQKSEEQHHNPQDETHALHFQQAISLVSNLSVCLDANLQTLLSSGGLSRMAARIT